MSTPWDAAWDHIAAADKDLAAVLSEIGPPPARDREPGLDALIAIIVDQQVSKVAGAAIKKRLDAFWGDVTPDGILAATEEDMRGCGLSRPKVRTLKAVAEALDTGTLDFDRLAVVPEADAYAEMVAIKGIGRWTAEVYLMFALGRADVWPAQDVALQAAMQVAKDLSSRPTVKEMDALSEPLRPYRSAAALLLWRYHRHVRGIDLSLP